MVHQTSPPQKQTTLCFCLTAGAASNTGTRTSCCQPRCTKNLLQRCGQLRTACFAGRALVPSQPRRALNQLPRPRLRRVLKLVEGALLRVVAEALLAELKAQLRVALLARAALQRHHLLAAGEISWRDLRHWQLRIIHPGTCNMLACTAFCHCFLRALMLNAWLSCTITGSLTDRLRNRTHLAVRGAVHVAAHAEGHCALDVHRPVREKHQQYVCRRKDAKHQIALPQAVPAQRGPINWSAVPVSADIQFQQQARSGRQIYSLLCKQLRFGTRMWPLSRSPASFIAGKQ